MVSERVMMPLQIFSVEGTKHIGIYAKRRIMPGEELSYDYKVRSLCPCHSYC